MLLFVVCCVTITFVFRWTPLHGGRDEVEICQVLIAFDADLECASEDGYTPLLYAASWTSVDTVQLLLDLNADTTKTGGDGWTVSQSHDEEIQQLLLEHSTKSVHISVSVLIFIHDFRQESERKQLRLETLARIRNKVGIRLMRYAHPDIVDICLALAPFDLPPYVLLEIIDWLPQFARLSHHKKIHLIQAVWHSIRKINGTLTVFEVCCILTIFWLFVVYRTKTSAAAIRFETMTTQEIKQRKSGMNVLQIEDCRLV